MTVSGLFGNLFTGTKKPDFCSKEEFDIYTAVNEVRKDSGVQTLELDEELCQIARIRAKEQTELKGHTRPDGSRFYTVFKENGYETHVAAKGERELPFVDVLHNIPFERSPIKISNISAFSSVPPPTDSVHTISFTFII